MAKTVYYTAVDNVVLAPNAQGTLEYTPGPNEKFFIESWRFTSSGIFDILDIRNSENFHYTQASVSVPIPSTHVQNPGNAFLALKDFDPAIEISERQNFAIDVKDTSGLANTIVVTLNGYKVIAGP